MLCHSLSTSLWRNLNKRCHFPFLDQRSKRLKTVFQGPNSLGKSRHGTPVLCHHNTAQTKLRSSFPGRPRPRSLSRNISIFAHWRSFNASRSAISSVDQDLDLDATSSIAHPRGPWHRDPCIRDRRRDRDHDRDHHRIQGQALVTCLRNSSPISPALFPPGGT